jgi:hypothetical protein
MLRRQEKTKTLGAFNPTFPGSYAIAGEDEKQDEKHREEDRQDGHKEPRNHGYNKQETAEDTKYELHAVSLT